MLDTLQKEMVEKAIYFFNLVVFQIMNSAT